MGSLDFWLVIVGILAIFFACSLRYVPTHPPHIAVVTFLGRRINKYKREGLRLFPFYPFLYNAILVDISTKNLDIVAEAQARDLAEIEIHATIGWSPLPDRAIEYLNRGCEKGITKILKDAAEEALREWAIAAEDGPNDFEEVLRTGRGTKMIIFKTIASLPLGLNKEDQEKILEKISKENGAPIPQLGIVLDFLRITKVRARGMVVDASTLIPKEKKQGTAEKIKFGYLGEILADLNKAGLSMEEALAFLKSERGAATKMLDGFGARFSSEERDKILRLMDDFLKSRA